MLETSSEQDVGGRLRRSALDVGFPLYPGGCAPSARRRTTTTRASVRDWPRFLSTRRYHPADERHEQEDAGRCAPLNAIINETKREAERDDAD